MSLEKAKKLEDLKEEVNSIFSARNKLIESQRPKAIVSALKEMTDYLSSQEFNVTINNGLQRGFIATYKDIKITASASKDEETFFGADYVIDIVSGLKKRQVLLNVKRGARVNPPLGGNIDQQIADYQNRYIPAVKELDVEELNGSYILSMVEEGRGTKKEITVANGQAVIEKIFE
ncbi:hypothetical protein [Erwinia rhapontici]|uniref:hypothetical protein n=1 Tax=Erwinia rhapontici TaxID=55212 RepID=UPI003BA0A5E4